MQHPSGNEDIPRSHWARDIVFFFLLLIGLALQAWVNLAAIASAAFPGWGGSGAVGIAVTAFARWGTVLHARTLTLTAFTHGYLPSVVHNPFNWSGLSQEQLYWLGQWRYALEHILGSPPLYMGVAWNAVFLVFVPILGALWAANRLVSTRSVDARLGTSEWAPPRALRPYLRAAGGFMPLALGRRRLAPGALPLGRITKGRPMAGREIALPLRDLDHHIGRFSHVSLWGVPEAGKTSGVIKPWLLEDGGLNHPDVRDREGWTVGAMSSVAVDMKHPDLFTSLAEYLAPLPRRLLVLAPGHPETSLRYNPLDFIALTGQPESISDIAVVADAIVMNTPLGYRDDAYYRAIETKLLELLIQFVVEARGSPHYQNAQRHVQAVVQPVLPPGMPAPPLCSFPMIALLTLLHSRTLLQLVSVEVGPVIHPQPDWWAARVAQFLQMDRQAAGMAGLLMGLSRRIALFTRPEVAGVSTHSDFSLDLLGRQPGTFLIGMPRLSTEVTQTYSALIITQLVQQLKRVASKSPGQRLPVPVTIYLDELANQGRIPRLEDEIATLRDMGVAFVLGMQNTDSLRARYGREAASSMISNTNTKIVLGRNLGTEDAEMFAAMAGDTTLLTPRTASGPGGASHGVAAARRAFMTPDQIRRMKQFEALVFLQSGHLVHTRLTPFHELGRELRRLPTDPVIATGRETADGFVHPVFLLRHRHAQLDGILGPWDVRPRTSAPPAAVPMRDSETHGQLMAKVLATASERDPKHIEEGGPEGDAEAHEMDAGSLQETSPPEGRAVAGHEKVPPPASAGHESSRDETPAVATATGVQAAGAAAGNGDGASPPSTERRAGQEDKHGRAGALAPVLESAALQDLTGFFRAITMRGTVISRENGGPIGWRTALEREPHLLVRWALLVAYADRAGLRATDISARWQRNGLVRPGRLQVTGHGEPVSVVAFTPLALERFIPAIADRIRHWPEVGPAQVRDGSTPARGTTSAVDPERGRSHGQAGRPARAALRNDPDGALRAVISWAQAHRAELSAPDRQLGQWDGVTQETSVLLIRNQQVMQILGHQHYDTYKVLVAWRDRGVIVTLPGRFTVRMRESEADGDVSKDSRGAYFMAFVWSAVQQTGLQR